ncbi:Desumoylating isopeptidase 2 [Aphelenchoides besseyi]|nr:Desumoylating isopeptidase 2 [Aphelenchoides besseyi]KAI6199916.1 Desumoylating isopeptidase 2 [Aphelenchoides besseyi]
MAMAPVRVNVYDMYWLNDYASTLGFGIYHSGVEVYGVEYAYGGHQFPFSGIFSNDPQDVEELGENFKFKQSIYLGETALSKKAVENLVKSFGDDFRGDRYHLITKNCNHFTTDFVRELTGLVVPGWINRLASVSSSVPFLERWIPQEWLTPMAIEAVEGIPPTRHFPYYIEKGEDALQVCGSPKSKKPVVVGQTAGPSSIENTISNGSNWKIFRRGSEAQSAPTTARRGSSSSTPPLARLWNSIKGIASDEPSIAPVMNHAAIAPTKSMANNR